MSCLGRAGRGVALAKRDGDVGCQPSRSFKPPRLLGLRDVERQVALLALLALLVLSVQSSPPREGAQVHMRRRCASARDFYPTAAGRSVFPNDEGSVHVARKQRARVVRQSAVNGPISVTKLRWLRMRSVTKPRWLRLRSCLVGGAPCCERNRRFQSYSVGPLTQRVAEWRACVPETQEVFSW